MHRAILAAQHGGAKIDLFHQARFSIDYCHIIHADLVFHHQEHSSQDVFDDVLRAEADGYARHTRAREQRPDVEIKFLEDHEAGYDPDEYEKRLA